MTQPKEQRDTGLAIHRWLQWIASIGVTVLSAMVIAGMGTWNDIQVFMIRLEDVPQDIKDIKQDVSEVKNETMNLKWKVANIETTKPRK